MERHFSCTACGKCCHGQLPLSIDDALAHADRFPLVLVWSTVRQGARSYDITAELGITLQLKKRKRAAIRIAPTAYLPASFPCPELAEDGLCAIHENKPQRCRTMPYSAYRDEADQDDLLLPRPGWECDISSDASLVYRNKAIVERDEFNTERDGLIRDSAILKPYAEWLIESVPSLKMDLLKAAMRSTGGQVIVAFSTLIPRLPGVDIYDLAEKQLPLMQSHARRTVDDPSLASFHKCYVKTAKEWEKVVNSRS